MHYFQVSLNFSKKLWEILTFQTLRMPLLSFLPPFFLSDFSVFFLSVFNSIQYNEFHYGIPHQHSHQRDQNRIFNVNKKKSLLTWFCLLTNLECLRVLLSRPKLQEACLDYVSYACVDETRVLAFIHRTHWEHFGHYFRHCKVQQQREWRQAAMEIPSPGIFRAISSHRASLAFRFWGRPFCRVGFIFLH